MKPIKPASAGVTLAFVMAFGLIEASAQTADASASSTAPAVAAGQKTKVEGTIVRRDGDTLVVRLSPTDTDITVKVGAFTEVQEKKNNPFRGARRYPASQLAPGLSVEIQGRGDSDGTLVAEKVRFTHTDYKIAKAADVRVAPVEENSRRMSGQVEELSAVSNAAKGGAKAAQSTADRAHDRITNLDDYDSVANSSIRFQVGSAVLSAEAKKSLDEIAERAKTQKGYVIELAGYASSEGSATLNRRLSRQRAQAVSEYLAEQHEIPLRRIMIPTGYGTSHPVADNATKTGRQENRRVEVRILVSKGLAASTAGSEPASGRSAATSSTPPKPEP